ncbi:MAG TPA: ParA family protein [Anaerolineales bacterium]|nr:ParA family protein [Anaerolineae bacterium]HIQ02482.1 ParA family protein [Anaerolineales bacterium]
MLRILGRRDRGRRQTPDDASRPLGGDRGRKHPGRVIGVLNYKGGTGKTTTVVNLAAGLALRGARVLCIDLDAQGGLATSLDVRYTHSLADLLLGRSKPSACVVQARENLDLIASDRSLLRAEGELWRIGEKAKQGLAERMRGVVGYDYVFLDYSPSLSLIGECGLRYNRELIVPVAMSYMALVGTRQVIETLKVVNDDLPGHRVRLSLIVPTFYDGRQRIDREIIELLHRYFADRVAEPIRASVKLSEATSRGMTIYEYAPRSSGAIDYVRLVERVARSG